MTWFIPLLALSQLPNGEPKDIARLRLGELARVYRYGGLTTMGPYYRLVVVTKSGKVFVKDSDGNRASQLGASQLRSLAATIQATDWRGAKASPRTESYGPSAYDGIDIYLSVRHRGIQSWNNIQWHGPRSFPLLDELERIGRAAKQ